MRDRLRRPTSRPRVFAVAIALLTLLGLGLATQARHGVAAEVIAAQQQQQTVQVRITDTGMEFSSTTVPSGPVTFRIRNDARVRYEVEIEGRGVDMEVDVLPNSERVVMLQLGAGRYEVEAESQEGPEREWKQNLTVSD